jgi:hypothetical protein
MSASEWLAIPRSQIVSEDTLAEMCLVIAQGRPVTTACRMHGVNVRQFLALLDRDEELAELIGQAKAQAEHSLLSKLATAIDLGKAHGGITWWLEKLDPQQWGAPTKRTEISGPNGQPIQSAITITVDQANRIARLPAKAPEPVITTLLGDDDETE